jgi:hypothetical protein
MQVRKSTFQYLIIIKSITCRSTVVNVGFVVFIISGLHVGGSFISQFSRDRRPSSICHHFTFLTGTHFDPFIPETLARAHGQNTEVSSVFCPCAVVRSCEQSPSLWTLHCETVCHTDEDKTHTARHNYTTVTFLRLCPRTDITSYSPTSPVESMTHFPISRCSQQQCNIRQRQAESKIS